MEFTPTQDPSFLHACVRNLGNYLRWFKTSI